MRESHSPMTTRAEDAGEIARGHIARVPQIDRLKAIATVGVVAFHVTGQWGKPRSPAVLALTLLLQPAVPAFLFASGFLHARRSRFPRGTLRKWATRLLPAYGVASVAALAIRCTFFGEGLSGSAMMRDLLTANAIGTYYFIFVLWELLALSLVLARAPRSTTVLFILLIAGPVLAAARLDPVSSVYPSNFLVAMRTPVPFVSYYLAGWLVANHHANVEDRRLCVAAGVLFIACLGCLFVRQSESFSWSPLNTTLKTASAYAAIMALFTMPRAEATRPIRWLSESSYGIYLWHSVVLFALVRSGVRCQDAPLPALGAVLGICVVGGAVAQQIHPSGARILLGFGNGSRVDVFANGSRWNASPTPTRRSRHAARLSEPRWDDYRRAS